MKFLDEQFINHLSPRLDRFTWERSGAVAKFRCPLCGDSKKSANKRRGHFFYDSDTDEFRFKCHNCSEMSGWSFGVWLKHYDGALYQEYSLKKFQESSGASRPLIAMRKDTAPKVTQTARIGNRAVSRDESLLGNMIRLDLLDDSHIAKRYVIGREIPPQFHSVLYYSDNFRQDMLSFETNEEKQGQIPDDPRLVIPFWTQDGRLKITQGRALLDDAYLRYVTIKPDDNDTKVYGEDRVDRKKTTLVVEGPIDSLFLPNCLATADADLLSAKGDIYIPDNQYRNKEVCRIIEKIIASGVRVVLFPPNVQWKDINDMVQKDKGGMNTQALYQLLAANVFQGMVAELRFSELRKV